MTSMAGRNRWNGTNVCCPWFVILLAFVVGLAAVAPGHCQDASAPATGDVATVVDDLVGEDGSASPSDDAVGNDSSSETAPAEAVPAGEAPEGDAPEGSALEGFVLLAIVVALFVLPMLIGGHFAKSLKMPDHGWKFATAIGTLAAAAVIIAQGEIKFGPDLSGGITLIYELQDTSALAEDAGEEGEDSQDQSTAAKRQTVSQLISALSERVDPSGTKEVTIREYGLDQIEIIIPKASQQELEFIERRIYTAGALEFRITASPVFIKNRGIIEQANLLPPGENEVWRGENKVAEWVAYSVEEFGPVDREDTRFVKRMAGKVPQALVLTDDGLDVTGEYLKKSSAGFDERGRPQVNFNFNQQGAFRFGQLSGKHVPTPSGQEYQLGILLDKKLLSAPSIQSKITSQGRITGISSKEEVDFVVGILNAGSLPAQLNKDPISRETISPTLGAETVEKGRTAILISLIAVMVFMLLYYRFAGMIACLALAANLLLILGLMVLFKAAFTLPGLAGLVLTVGMSVDANVLIFERIREERKRGAAMRMAILNGFARATQTIVDANVTTLITAIVIYKIAPDNVKGFGVTLILGIVMSMYTAIFLSRIVFDIAERTRRLKELNMAQIVKSAHFNFLGKRGLAAFASLVLIGIGLTVVVQRGDDLLNIDFTGGSSVTIVFDEDQTMPYEEIKDLLQQTELSDKNLSLVAVGDKGDRYTVSSVNQDVGAVQELLHDTFGNRLKTYQVKVEQIQALPAQASESDGDETQSPKRADPYAGGTSAQLNFSIGGDLNDDGGVSFDTVKQLVQDALDATGHGGVASSASNPDYQIGSARRFTQWEVKIALPEGQSSEVWDHLLSVTNDRPIFPLANKIGGRVAGDMKTKAIASIVISLLGIVAYIWIRFQRVMYGLAAVIALVHDVLITLGAIGVSAVFVEGVPGLADALMIEKFQISLPIVAAFLTIIGYSLNDTIVVFDRIREVKGKSPKLTGEMINDSINQTLSRTLLTSVTTLLSVGLLYALGGDGIHGFAFALVVGVIVGTYSSIFVASPALLWMSQRADAAAANSGSRRT